MKPRSEESEFFEEALFFIFSALIYALAFGGQPWVFPKAVSESQSPTPSIDQ